MDVQAHQTTLKENTKTKKLSDEVKELVKKKQMILDGKLPDESPFICKKDEDGTIVITIDTTKAKKAKKKKRTAAEAIVELQYLNYRNSPLSDIITFEEFCDHDKKRAAEAEYYAKLIGYKNPYEYIQTSFNKYNKFNADSFITNLSQNSILNDKIKAISPSLNPFQTYTEPLADAYKFYTNYSISELFNPFPTDRFDTIRSSLYPFEKLESIRSSLYHLEKYARQLIEEQENRIKTLVSHLIPKLTTEQKIEAIKNTGRKIIQMIDELEHEAVKELCYSIGSNLANIDYHTSDRYHQNRYQRAKAFIATVEKLDFAWIDQDEDRAYYYEDILYAVSNYLHIFDKIFNELKRDEEIKVLNPIEYIKSNPNIEYDRMLILLKEQILAKNRLIKIQGHKIVIHVVAQMLESNEEKLFELFAYLLHIDNKTTRYKFKKQILEGDYYHLPQDILKQLLP